VRKVNVILPMANLAHELGYKSLPGALIQGIDIHPAETLARLLFWDR